MKIGLRGIYDVKGPMHGFIVNMLERQDRAGVWVQSWRCHNK